MIPSRRRVLMVSLGLSLVLVLLSLLALSIGSAKIPAREIVHMMVLHGFNAQTPLSSENESILFDIRIPRVFLAMSVGMALSVAGASFQALLRNPLADPHVLGVSSGAALGAMLSIVLGIQYTVGTPLASFIGALVTITVVY